MGKEGIRVEGESSAKFVRVPKARRLGFRGAGNKSKRKHSRRP